MSMEELYTTYVERLMKGDDPEVLVAFLKMKYTLQSVATIVSIVRKRIKQRNQRHSEYDSAPLLMYRGEEGVAEFLNASVEEQERIQMRHRKVGGWSPHAEDALSRLKILPECLEVFKMSEAEVREIKKQKADAQKERDINIVKIPNADSMLQTAISNLERAKSKDSYPRLGLSLMLVSGRRTTEIYSPKSQFRQAGDSSVFFLGQLKKKGDEEGRKEYAIPLLCPARVFLRAVQVLRAKQAQHLDKDKIYSEEEINNRYGGSARRYLHKLWPAVKRGGKRNGCVHLLRSCYASFVFYLYERNKYSLHYLYKSILGHGSKAESDAYACVVLEGIDHLRGSLGPCLVVSDGDGGDGDGGDGDSDGDSDGGGDGVVAQPPAIEELPHAPGEENPVARDMPPKKRRKSNPS